MTSFVVAYANGGTADYKGLILENEKRRNRTSQAGFSHQNIQED